MCDGLEYIHKEGYQHFDLNPKNILIVDNSIRIGDFSHCFKISKGTAYKHLIGTYQFMAPEIFEKSECSGTEDIYSLGITLYVLLTGGKLPYDYQNRKPQVRHKEDEINIVFMCDDLVNIIAKASAYDAIDRYQNIHEFRDALKTFYDNHKGSLDEQIPRKHFDSNEHTVFPENNWEHISTQVTMGIPLEDAEQKNEYDYASIALDELPNGTKQCEEVSNLSNDGDNRIDGIENEGTKLDSVQFVAIADKKIDKDDIGIIEIGMYTDSFKGELIDQIKGEFSDEIETIYSNYIDVNEKASVTVKLSGRGLTIEEDTATHRLNGRYLKFTFDYYVPIEFHGKKVLFTVDVYFDGIIATTLKFTLDVNNAARLEHKISREDIKTAFLSYAREDTTAVTYILQAIKKVRPDLDVFFDVEKLRSGDDWENRLYAELLRRDRLFLCWSHFAAASEWVNREWEYVIDNKGIDSIEPIPLESPDSCPAPTRLQGLHFNDIEIMIRNAYNMK